MKIFSVVGCRPNFVKIAPLAAEMKKHQGISHVLIHTGQHYDASLSDVFFRDLNIPRPDICLNVGSASHAQQTSQIMSALEEVLLNQRPDLVIVPGDVNSTLASSLTAVKLGIPVAHVEAGLRSFDREMPEEINRIVTDSVSDFLFASEPSGVQNLIREGRPREKIFFVGNVLIDTLYNNLEAIDRSKILEEQRLSRRGYVVLTLHRPSNVDRREQLEQLLEVLLELQEQTCIVFPVHPRTAARLADLPSWKRLNKGNVRILDPLGYLDFIRLLKDCRFTLSDSGGIQEETTALGVPCLTLRRNTERPVTLTHGTNRLVGTNPEVILKEAQKLLQKDFPTNHVPEKWDGQAAQRIVRVLRQERSTIEALYHSVREIALCGKRATPVT